MTIQDMVDGMNERGTFWWMVHEANFLPIADWIFLVIIVFLAANLVVGIVLLVAGGDRRRDQDFEARAARLGYVKGGERGSGSEGGTAP